MEPVSEETTKLVDDLADDELDSAFKRAMAPAERPLTPQPGATAKAGERLHTLVSEVKRLKSEVKRLTEDELVHVQALAGADEWFLENDGHPVGPLTLQQMKDRWMAEAIGPETLCWGVGLPGWTPLCRVSSLTKALGPQPDRPVPLPTPVPAAPQHAKPAPSAQPPPPPAAKELLPEVAALPPEPATEPAMPPVLEAPPPRTPRRAPRPLAPPAPRPLYRADQEDDVEPRVSAAHRWGRVVIGLLVVAGALAFLAMPFLSPPAPELPPPPIEIPPAAALNPAPAASQQAKKVSVNVKSVTTGDESEEVEEAEGAEEQAPAASTPEADAEFDRAFGKPPDEPKAAASKPAERTVYVPPAPPKANKPKARLSDGDIMQVVVAHKAQVKRCLNEALAKEPDLSGRLVMSFTVSLDGAPENVEPIAGELVDTELAECVTKLVQGWKFPRHTEAQPPISFPFVF